MFEFVKNIFGKYSYDAVISEITSFEEELSKLSDNELKDESLELREKLQLEGASLDEALPRAFALIREAAKRNLNQRHYDEQLIGGIVLHQGKIAEMRTGEGKTLAATSPVYLNALTGKGVHVITVNDYLAKRDAVWMGQIYYALGLSVGCLVHDVAYLYDPKFVEKQEEGEKEEIEKERDEEGSFKVHQEFLRPVSRHEAYQADILYGTNHEFGFDYLRDNLSYRKEDQVQRKHYFAIIDEVDSILIDEARTPLIIAAPDTESSDYYKIFARAVNNLEPEVDYVIDEKVKTVTITDSGINKIEKALSLEDLYAPENFQLVHYLEESLKAKALFHRDKQYMIKEGEVIIVDEFTGRLMPGRRYSGGLHQAIEAKENVEIKQESRTYAQITLQNYFRLYEKIAGMTGTAQTSAEEFHKVYNLEVATIPTHREIQRDDKSDVVFKTTAAKYRAIVNEIKEIHTQGRPILVGTTSINNNEIVSALLNQAGIKHEVLNAKNHEREGEIVAQAGKLGAVTVATNMAGRGVDILLGGNPATEEESKKVKELGGLHIVGTERHEARRIDNQLRGRAGRQGDPGSSQFFLSLEDDLMRIFGGDRVKSIMETLKFPEDEPIQSGIISRVVNEAQKKVEGLNFDARKHLLEYDDILNKQRTTIYRRRQEILEGDIKEVIAQIVDNVFETLLNQIPDREQLEKILIENGIASENELKNSDDWKELINNKIRNLIKSENELEIRINILAFLDRLWMTHLENLEDLRDSVRIRAYGQHDPLIEYRREGYNLFQSLVASFEEWVFYNIWQITQMSSDKTINTPLIIADKEKSDFGNVNRNDPCPCGSGKKYKKCHGSSN